MYWIYLPIMKKWLNLHNVDTVSEFWGDVPMGGQCLKCVTAMMQSGTRVLVVDPGDMKQLLESVQHAPETGRG